MPTMIHTASGPIYAKLTIPGSKSMTQRAILLAALADNVSEISGIYIDDDIRAFVFALHQFGIVVQLDESNHSCIVAGGNGKLPKKQASLLCEKSCIVTQFLLASCAATSGVYYFEGPAQMNSDSLIQLLDLLCQQGAQVIPSDCRKLPFTLLGSDSLKGGDILLDHAIQTDAISALLMIAPFTKSSFTLTALHPINQYYLETTCAMMAEFGVLVHHIHDGQFTIPVPQRYHANDYMVEPDFSIAAYFYAAVAITGGELCISSILKTKSKQSDSKFLAILEKIGCQLFETEQGLTVSKSTDLHGIDISIRTFSNNLFALAAIAPFANAPTKISHAGVLHTTDLQDMEMIKTEWNKLSIQVELGDNWIRIFPGKPMGAHVSSHHEYRLGMALAIMSLATSNMVIDDTECIINHCPQFFELIDALR
jgi:3-phosphoshikimate 1-carboxyvinyltransferase